MLSARAAVRKHSSSNTLLVSELPKLRVWNERQAEKVDWRILLVVLPRFVEHLSDFTRHGVRGERFLKKVHALFYDASMDSCFFGITGYVEDL